MNTIKWRYVTILVAGLVGAGQAASAGNDSSEALDASRRVALEHLGAGERTAAATHLLTTLRETARGKTAPWSPISTACWPVPRAGWSNTPP